MNWKIELPTRALAAAGGLLAIPAALAAHPHEGAGGLAHGVLHFFLGAGHLLPALGAAAVTAAAAAAGLVALRRMRAPARRRQEARERR